MAGKSPWSKTHDVLMLMLITALIDGELSGYEQRAIRVRMMAWGVSEGDAAALSDTVMARLKKYGSGEKLRVAVQKSCAHFLKSTSDRPILARVLAQSVADVASADGRLDRRARAITEEVLSSLGLADRYTITLQNDQLVVKKNPSRKAA